MLLKYFWVSCLCACPVLLSAQDYFQEKPVRLEEVRITSSRLRDYAVGASVLEPDSSLVKLHQSESLSSLLSAASGVNLKTYGAGGLSSVSLRGGMPDHTAVLWNGLNIKSPMNGGINFSVLPVSLFGNVKIQYGGSATLFGSGAMSGVVHLDGNDLPGQPASADISATMGSFGFGAMSGSLKTGTKKFGSRTALYLQTADNDFPYKNTSRIGHPEEIQTNAGMNQLGGLQENQWRINDHSLLTSAVWFQYYDKDLQTLMTSRQQGETNQTDKNLAVSLNYKYYAASGHLTLKQGLLRNKVVYSDPAMADPQSDNNSLSWINEAEYKLRLGELHSILAGVNYTYESAESDGYRGSVFRNRLAAFVSGRLGMSGGEGALVLSLRDEMTDGQIHPVVFSFGAEHGFLNAFRIKGNISRNYRIPNLNDLYWKEDGFSAGNPALEPESGWSGDAGIVYSYKGESFSTGVSVTGFASSTKDIIVWLPENGGKWTPRNKKNGDTRGIEANFNFSAIANKSRLSGRVFYTYTSSVLTSSDEYDEKQMIYIPKHQMSSNMEFSRNSFYSILACRFTGERYYDYSKTLDAYFIMDASVGYRFSLAGLDADISVKILNLTDRQYQIVAWYAMPPRNYKFTLNITI